MITRFTGYWAAALACTVVLVAAAPAGATPALDTAFGGGIVTPKVFPGGKLRQVARGAALQPDGKVVVAMGLAKKYGMRSRRPVMRFNADGTPDQSFGTGGTAWFGLRGAKRIGLIGVVLAPDGKLLVYGARYRKMTGPGDYFVARLGSDGSLDRSYGVAGERRLARKYHGESRLIVSVLMLPDGSSLAALERFDGGALGTSFKLDLVHLSAGGKVDHGFGASGAALVKLSTEADFADVVDLVVAGRDLFILSSASTPVEGVDHPCKIQRVRISRSGVRPVNSFGGDGSVELTSAGSHKTWITCDALAATTDGGLAVAGSDSIPVGTGDEKDSFGLVVKLLANGKRDGTFGSGGRQYVRNGENLAGILQTSDGGFLVTGLRLGPNPDPEQVPIIVTGTAALLDAHGALVPSFGTNGSLDLAPGCGGGKIQSNAGGIAALFTLASSTDDLGSRIVKFTT
jgi:uncharacterized delta-60 repeat protein